MYNVFPSTIDPNSYPCMKRGPLEKQCETNIYGLVDKLTSKTVAKEKCMHQIVKYTKKYQFKFVRVLAQDSQFGQNPVYVDLLGTKTSR